MRFSLSLAAIGLLASSALGADSTSDRMAVVKSKRATAGPTEYVLLLPAARRSWLLTRELTTRPFFSHN